MYYFAMCTLPQVRCADTQRSTPPHCCARSSRGAWLDESDGNTPSKIQQPNLREYYRSFPMTTLSLLMAIPVGKTWGLMERPLVHISTVCGLLFVLYIAVWLIGVLIRITCLFWKMRIGVCVNGFGRRGDG